MFLILNVFKLSSQHPTNPLIPVSHRRRRQHYQLAPAETSPDSQKSGYTSGGRPRRQKSHGGEGSDYTPSLGAAARLQESGKREREREEKISGG
jgi:hypothetical protein